MVPNDILLEVLENISDSDAEEELCDFSALSIHINDGEAIYIPFTTARWFNHR